MLVKDFWSSEFFVIDRNLVLRYIYTIIGLTDIEKISMIHDTIELIAMTIAL